MEAGTVILAVVQLVLVLVAYGLGTVEGVQFIKAVAGLFGGLKADWKKALADHGPVIASVSLAILGALQFEANAIELVKDLGFANIDPELALWLTGLIVALLSNKIYDRFVKKQPPG